MGIVRRMTKSTHRVLVSLDLPEPVAARLTAVGAMLQAMTDNPWFPDPSPSLATVAAALAEVRQAEVAAQSKTVGTVAFRDEKLVALDSLLKRLKAYVQGVADDNPGNAGSIIETAGMSAWKAAAGPKPPITVKAGRKPGTVEIVVRAAAKEATYEWQWSADGGQTWVTAPTTLQAKTLLTGLPSGVVCLFRFRTVTRKVGTNWCAPQELRVP